MTWKSGAEGSKMGEWLEEGFRKQERSESGDDKKTRSNVLVDLGDNTAFLWGSEEINCLQKVSL